MSMAKAAFWTRTDFQVCLFWALDEESCFQVVSSQFSHPQQQQEHAVTQGLCDNKMINLEGIDLHCTIKNDLIYFMEPGTPLHGHVADGNE